MLALLKRREREHLSFRSLSELSGEPIWRLAYCHRILFKTHPGFVEVTPSREAVVLDSSKSFDVTLMSGVRVAVAPGFDALRCGHVARPAGCNARRWVLRLPPSATGRMAPTCSRRLPRRSLPPPLSFTPPAAATSLRDSAAS
ncbi:MAG: hypothetical protein IPH13_02160 [Planctomycetes bacterium]|nr:hypothetical protein [Planctomycetota bacterium]MCC7171216.1 hypothetical protein [Planctomycetota bacterium]